MLVLFGKAPESCTIINIQNMKNIYEIYILKLEALRV